MQVVCTDVLVVFCIDLLFYTPYRPADACGGEIPIPFEPVYFPSFQKWVFGGKAAGFFWVTMQVPSVDGAIGTLVHFKVNCVRMCVWAVL